MAFKPINDAIEFASKYGILTFCGVGLVLVGNGLLISKVVTSSPPSTSLSAIGLESGLAGFASLVGVVLVIVGSNRVRNLQSGGSGIDCVAIDRQISDVLGAVSLSERNEAAREQVVRLLAILPQPTESTSKVTFHGVLTVLYDFLSIGRDHLAPTADQTRFAIKTLLTRGKEMGFEPPVLEEYLVGLHGLTYLVESFSPQNARDALRDIEPTVTRLKTMRVEKRYGFATLLNGNGICHGILSSEDGISIQRRLDHLADAHQAFQAQLATDQFPGPVTVLTRYRTLVNSVELTANAYWVWRQCKEEDQSKEALAKLEPFVPEEFRNTTVRFISKLFKSAYENLETALGIAERERFVQVKRPAVFVTRGILATSLAYAENDGVISPDFKFPDLDPSRICEFFESACELMENELLSGDMLRALTYSPIVSSGLLKVPIPSLEPAKQFLTQKIDALRRSSQSPPSVIK